MLRVVDEEVRTQTNEAGMTALNMLAHLCLHVVAGASSEDGAVGPRGVAALSARVNVIDDH
jgi:hypothetical protein